MKREILCIVIIWQVTSVNVSSSCLGKVYIPASKKYYMYYSQQLEILMCYDSIIILLSL